ncbi:pilus assembly protein [Agarivorans sp.]|uniref:pilus assembly protein n=1 Tax=Agarivorans sp. TaxID=1872412 RepID=UPI003D07D392
MLKCFSKLAAGLALFALTSIVLPLKAADLNLATKPLHVASKPPPMVMLVMGRDHTLYYEAYNDASDLTGNDRLNLHYDPININYAGYFDSQRCYSYSSEGEVFVPGAAASSTKACTGSDPWSGDFLNYLTMTRMDVLRAVLYGGYRRVDTETATVLERVFVPQDAHSWGKSYTSKAVDGYSLADYTPFANPRWGKKHFFGTASFSDGGKPEFKVRLNVGPSDIELTGNIWEWASTERPVLSSENRDIKDENIFTIRVQVCVAGKLEANCKQYSNGQYKPTGLLHDYGENGSMEFGLLTGSYDKNTSGGVLRRPVGDFSDEIDATNGTFKASVPGIVNTINKLKIYGFIYGTNKYEYSCGWIATRQIVNGECPSWGNPVGEMLYESLRYFHGEGFASSSYSSGSGWVDEQLGLPSATWDKPFDNREYCAAPYNLVISDINPSYDADELPGAKTSFKRTDGSGNAISYSGSTLSGYHLSNLLDEISKHENISGNYFIGESLNDDPDPLKRTTSAPTAKPVRSLANIRGLSPAEPTKGGSYSAAAAAYYGQKTDLFPNKPGKQNIRTMVVAISSPLPEVKVDVKVGDEVKMIKIVPFAKSVRGESINKDQGQFQPTNTIVDYYVESFSSTSGVFRINFEDVEQGADHDMDMIVQYSYEVAMLCPLPSDDPTTCNKRKGVKLSLDSQYAYGGLAQHAGYVISGTTKDGIYLDVRDKKDGEGRGEDDDSNKVKYYLDTPAEDDSAFPHNSRRSSSANNDVLELTRTRHFFPGSSSAELLPSPLWYAAKWGGFEEKESEANGLPDAGEWDKEQTGQPDDYFPVTNAGELKKQIGKALHSAQTGNQSSAAPVFSNTFLSSNTHSYRTNFVGGPWNGDVLAYARSSSTKSGFSLSPSWSAAARVDAMAPNARHIFTRNNSSERFVDFVAPNSLDGADDGLSAEQISALLAGQAGSDDVKLAYLSAVINYLRGDRSYEALDLDERMRERKSAHGDVINSTPYYVALATGHDVTKPVLVYGANDGMVHIIDAENGNEIMAYVPSQIFSGLTSLSKTTYNHQYFVDGGINAYTDTNDITTVVGSLGTGYKGLYAIDVSDMSSANKNKLKWEIDTNTTGFSGLGYTQEQPTIAKLANGRVGVIFANGYNSADGEGQLFIADLADGSLIRSLKTGVARSDDPTGQNRANALASPAVVDINSDGIADRIYAGDLFGNMWVFDVSSYSSTEWGLATNDNKPLFTARSPTKDASNNYIAQPITTRPAVGVHPYGLSHGVLVAFGTGKYIENGDNNFIGEPTQTVYAIWDKLDGTYLTNSRTRVDGEHVYSQLLAQKILEEDPTNRRLSEYPINWNNHKGWYLDLVNTEDGNTNNYGERQVTNSLLLANKLSFTTVLPNQDPCLDGGDGWYMEVNLHSGTTWNRGTPGNTDPNDDTDTIENDSSHQRVKGIPSSPTVVIDSNLDEHGVVKEEGIIEKTCITLSNGSMLCYDDYKSPTGRLSLRALY